MWQRKFIPGQSSLSPYRTGIESSVPELSDSRHEEERVANKLLVSILMQAHPALVDNGSRLLY